MCHICEEEKYYDTLTGLFLENEAVIQVTYDVLVNSKSLQSIFIIMPRFYFCLPTC